MESKEMESKERELAHATLKRIAILCKEILQKNPNYSFDKELCQNNPYFKRNHKEELDVILSRWGKPPTPAELAIFRIDEIPNILEISAKVWF